jgi:putative ABC transport system permease protein
MKLAAWLQTWWRALFHRTDLDSQIESELRFHMESYAADLMSQGVPGEEAMRRARVELGTTASQREQCRSAFGVRPLDDLRADLRYAFRQLRHSPTFTVAVLLVLTLGIGANAAMFSVIDATLLRWLPYSRPAELESLTVTDAKGNPMSILYPDIVEWKAQSHTLESLAYYRSIEGFVGTNGGTNGGGKDGAHDAVAAEQTSHNLFAVLGVHPALGRGFAPDEQQPGKGRVIVLSDAVWRMRFQQDREIVGKEISFNDEAYTVIGVMPPRFIFPAYQTEPQVWVPAEITAEDQKRDFSRPQYEVIARLGKGVPEAAARADLSAIQQQLAPLYKHALAGGLGPSRVELMPYRQTLVKQSRTALLALAFAVAMIWLIACANVASLMLARGTARQRELSVREALGASRWRIVRQLFTESLVLSGLGALLGLGVSQLVLIIFSKTLSTKLSTPEHLAPNPTVLGALLILSVLSAVLFGLFPAWLAARTPLEHSLRQDSMQAGASRQRHRLQNIMVVAEIGLSLVLLVACGLLLRTVFALRQVPLGFRTDHVLMVQPNLPRYAYRNVDVNRAVFQPLLERVQQMNGVRAASLTTIVPLHRTFDSQMTLNIGHGENSKELPIRINAKLRAAGPELQEVLGFRMYKGRYFNQQDTPDGPPVAVVNRAFARLFEQQRDIMSFKMGIGKNRAARIVGVIDDFHQAAIDKPSYPEIDFCAPQLKPTDGFYQPTLLAHVELAIRTTADPASFIPDLKRVMAEVNPDLKTSSFETMDQIVEDSMGSQLLAARLLEVLAGAAFIVALAGLYGLLTYLVTQRKNELGVRLALGAQHSDIITMLLIGAGKLLSLGAAIGLVLAWFASRMLVSFLYGVHPHDGWTIAAVTAVLLICGLSAAYLPARRASRMDPLIVLRGE